MKNNYGKAIEYWDNVFGQAPEYDPSKEINIREIEDSISWLAEDCRSVIDFGCGNGRIIFRCLSKGMDHVCGMDISNSAVKKAVSIAESFHFKDKVQMICGGVEKLKTIDDNSFDSAILFNILDNLTPEDSMKTIRNIHRIVKPNGKILIKLNPYLTDQQKQECGLKEISPELYKDDEGLYLWNISSSMREKITAPFFVTEKYKEIEFKQYNMIIRMYYLRNRK